MAGRWTWAARAAGAFLMAAAALLSASAQDNAKSSPEALQIYQDAANFQNNGAFDLAVEEWQKFLKNHPKDPLAGKAQHYLGVCQLQLKQFDKAAAAFAAVIKDHPKLDLLEDAHLNLGWSQYSLAGQGKEGMHAKAAESFAELVKKYPKGKYVDQGLFYRAEALYALGKKEEAVASYDQLIQDHPKSSLRCDGLYALGVTREELSQFAEAGKVYDLFLKECSESPLVTEVKMRKAETVLQGGDAAAAEKMFGEVAGVKDFAAADHALFRQAFCLSKLDKFAEAAVLYAKIPQQHADSAYVADATMAAGRCFYRADKLAEASPHFQKTIDKKTADAPEAAHWLARILLRDKKPAEAAELAGKAAGSAGDSPYAVNLKMDQADGLYEVADRKAEALALYAKLAQDHPQHELAPQALYNAAFTALELKQFDDGLKHAAAFVNAYPEDKLLPDVKYVSAECQLQQKQYAAAADAFRELATDHASHAEADNWRVRLGLALYLEKKYEEVVKALAGEAGKLKNKDHQAEAQFLVGASQFYLDKTKEAQQALKASLAANPKWRQADEALLLLSRAQRKEDQVDEAKTTVSKLIAEFPQSGLLDQAHYRLGEYHYAADEFAPAIKEYELVATKFPESPFVPYALYGEGWAQVKTKEFPAATKAFTQLLDKHAGHALEADARFGRAMSRRQEGSFKEAIEDLTAYLKTNPDPERQADALYERGLAEVGMKSYAAAATTFTALVKDHPKYGGADKALYELGWALKSQDKHAEAVPHFTALAKDHPDSPLAAEAWFHVGESQYDDKAYAEAVKSYEQAKAKAAKGELGEKALYKLGWAHFQQKQYDAAKEEFAAQVAAYPQGPLAADGVFMKAECLFREQNYKEAFPAFQAATKTKASSPAIETLILLHGGQSAAQVKEWDQAIGLLAQVPEKFPDSTLVPEALYELGWATQNAGQLDEALPHYEAAATKSRDHVGARARFMLGEAYFEKKQFAEAVREFQRAMFGYGGDQATEETKNWQAKSGYEAGRCAEVQINGADAATKAKLLADAQRFYQFVVDKHPKHELAGEAKKRVDALAKLK